MVFAIRPSVLKQRTQERDNDHSTLKENAVLRERTDFETSLIKTPARPMCLDLCVIDTTLSIRKRAVFLWRL